MARAGPVRDGGRLWHGSSRGGQEERWTDGSPSERWRCDRGAAGASRRGRSGGLQGRARLVDPQGRVRRGRGRRGRGAQGSSRRSWESPPARRVEALPRRVRPAKAASGSAHGRSRRTSTRRTWSATPSSSNGLPARGRVREFPEVDKAAWWTINEARTKLHKGQAPILDALLAALDDRGEAKE